MAIHGRHVVNKKNPWRADQSRDLSNSAPGRAMGRSCLLHACRPKVGRQTGRCPPPRLALHIRMLARVALAPSGRSRRSGFVQDMRKDGAKARVLDARGRSGTCPGWCRIWQARCWPIWPRVDPRPCAVAGNRALGAPVGQVGQIHSAIGLNYAESRPRGGDGAACRCLLSL